MATINEKEDLVAAIDRTAFKLLRKIGGDDTITAQDSAILTEQVKAFGEIVKWATARRELVPKQEADSKFSVIKGSFHAASRTPRSRRSANQASAEGSADADLGADAGPDSSDSGTVEDD